MKFQTIILLMLLIAFQGCSVYKSGWNKVSLDKAIGKSEVKFVTETGQTFFFKKIVSGDRGHVGINQHTNDSIKIYPSANSKIYIRDLLLEDAVGRGKVKVFTKAGQKIKFKNIVLKDGVYYGKRSKNKERQLSQNEISTIYPKDKTMSTFLTLLAITPPLILIAVFIDFNT